MATFRDPAGELQLTEEYAIRRIHPAAVEETLSFLSSPLRAALEKNGDLIPTEILSPPAHASAPPGELLLRHPRVYPISYPWEWTTGQWRAAAELTLRIADQAIDAGWMLKDATPLNILFVGTRPILVDVLSLEKRNPHSSVWLAYGQFVRTFLLPLIAAKHLKWPFHATQFVRDGYEPRDVYDALSPWQRLNPDLLDVVTLATIFENKKVKPTGARPTPAKTNPELVTHILHRRLARLGKLIRNASRTQQQSQWSEYKHTASHYLPADTAAKQRFVMDALAQCTPRHVLDIGANTGTYSQLAAEAGAEVTALDSDQAAIESLWQRAAQRGDKITPLVANIARPTPAVGWRNQEQLSLLDRLAGKSDMVFMLAVIHHLILREQIPLALIASLCSTLTKKWLILEWVPPADPMYQEWLRGRDDLYGSLSEADLTGAFAPFFTVAGRSELGNKRVLILFERTFKDKPMLEVSSG